MCFCKFKNVREQIEHFSRLPEFDMVAVAVANDCGIGDSARARGLFRLFAIFFFDFSCRIKLFWSAAPEEKFNS